MHYDAFIIGAGQAGPTLAAFFAEDGQQVALAEGAKLGGSCVNYGCTPTKAMRASARVAYQMRRSAVFGIHNEGMSVNFREVMARKDDIVESSRSGLRSWLESLDNLDILYDYASFDGKEADGAFRVQVGDETHTAERVYLNVGTRAFIPPIEGIDEVPYLDNVALMNLRDLPEHMVILGGGYIGLEMGQIFRRLGSEVTIIETSTHVASREDTDVSEEIERIFTDEGITLMTGYRAMRVSQDDAGTIHVGLEDENGNSASVRGSHLLVATGRVPNTDTLNLESIGLETDQRGYIATNGKLETVVANVWALGDINRRGAFTHTSYHDHQIVRDNHNGADRSADDRTMAYCMYTDPPMGRVGMSEREARNSDKNILIARHRMENVSRAKEDGETNGLVKLIVDGDTERFLGATIFGMQGDDVVQVVSNYMATGASYKHMQNALPIHPTISEFFPTWLGMLEPLDETEGVIAD